MQIFQTFIGPGSQPDRCAILLVAPALPYLKLEELPWQCRLLPFPTRQPPSSTSPFRSSATDQCSVCSDSSTPLNGHQWSVRFNRFTPRRHQWSVRFNRSTPAEGRLQPRHARQTQHSASRLQRMIKKFPESLILFSSLLLAKHFLDVSGEIECKLSVEFDTLSRRD